MSRTRKTEQTASDSQLAKRLVLLRMRIDKMKKDKQELTGELKQLKRGLQKEFDCRTPQQAQALLGRLSNKAKRLGSEAETMVTHLEKVLGI